MKAYNKITGLFWTGTGFSGIDSEAKILTDVEIITLKYAYQNVVTQP